VRKKKNSGGSSSVFKIGAISLSFLILGYQIALFVHRTSVLRVESLRDSPDTVYIVSERNSPVEYGEKNILKSDTVRRFASHSPEVQMIRERTRKVESFRFDPNTVSSEELQLLGFSPKQASSIINYRNKGGRFSRKSDFAKSFVVSDSIYKRLEPFIVIPPVDINSADSAKLDALPGIGPYFVKKILEYREEHGGFSSTDQLMDIKYFDREKYDAIADLITCGDGASE